MAAQSCPVPLAYPQFQLSLHHPELGILYISRVVSETLVLMASRDLEIFSADVTTLAAIGPRWWKASTRHKIMRQVKNNLSII
mmetsp:Transcript_36687/g.83689  ORF Transcript_36687/g.83689 Transcript_36687/m.83689 type:complete len:83 (+) Transcript_36687:493-741(+)